MDILKIFLNTVDVICDDPGLKLSVTLSEIRNKYLQQQTVG